MTREQWMMEAVALATPAFAEAGKPLPSVRAVISPPHAPKKRAIGLCWHATCVEDSAREVWVSSGLTETMDVFATLVHELCHAALPDGEGHGRGFKALAKAMLLEGKATATVPGDAFKAKWSDALEALGPIPGARFKATATAGERKPQASNAKKNLKCPECDFAAKVRVDQMGWGRLVCPVCDVKLLSKEEMGE